MKKFMMMAAIAIAALCASCASKGGCYEAKFYQDGKYATSEFCYCQDEKAVDAFKAECEREKIAGEEETGAKVTYSVEKVSKSQADCK